VNLADDGIAGDTRTKTGGNLAGGETVAPEFLQKLHPVFGPGHFLAAGGW
jgi:hypothetical protein